MASSGWGRCRSTRSSASGSLTTFHLTRFCESTSERTVSVREVDARRGAASLATRRFARNRGPAPAEAFRRRFAAARSAGSRSAPPMEPNMTKDRADRTDVPGLEGTPYRVVREIGRGGMGSVHEVQHRALGKIFVMKVLHESLAHREDFALRMKREWRMLARLEHPAIVQVTDAGQTTEGLPFFVMERLDGQTLAEALHARGRLSPREAAEMMLVVLSGLEAAHRAGAIHRDIKPQNLFLTPRGPKILDFGIAKSKRKRAAFVTRSGVAIGTPRYMAPEQAAGLAVDARTDIYACALVLFEMIAGRDPYAHLGDQAALVSAQINEPAPRLDDVRLDVPAP